MRAGSLPFAFILGTACLAAQAVTKNGFKKERVLGIEVDGAFKAYPFKELSLNGAQRFVDRFRGKTLHVHWNESAQSAYITDPHGKELVTTIGYWFAWYTFHPETAVFDAASAD